MKIIWSCCLLHKVEATAGDDRIVWSVDSAYLVVAINVELALSSLPFVLNLGDRN